MLTFRRTTTREVQLHGQRLPAGEKVVLFYHSGNRDERAIDRPWAFDVSRDPNRHVGFGGAARTIAWARRWPRPTLIAHA